MAAQPILTVIVTVVSDTTQETDTRHLERCLDALEHQVNPPEMEVLVACDDRLRGIGEFERRFPWARVVRTGNLRTAWRRPSREHHNELRAIGIRQARGELVALLEDHDRPDPHWCAQLVEEHRQPHAAIGGAIENGVGRALNWAVYFGDFGRYQNPVPRGPSAFASDANVCYKRAALERVADAWHDVYSEVRIHAALEERGEIVALSPDVIVYQHRLDLRLGVVLQERYVWGRSYAAERSGTVPPLRRVVLAALSPLLPLVLLFRQFRNVLRTRRNRVAFLWALPLTALLDLVWSYGEFVGYLTGHPSGSPEAAKLETQV